MITLSIPKVTWGTLSISGGIISGTTPYNASGEYELPITATDSEGAASTKVLTIKVNNKNRAPYWKTTAPEEIIVEGGDTYTLFLPLHVVDPDEEQLTYSIKDSSWSSAVLSSDTLIIIPSLDDAGTTKTVSVIAEDSAGLATVQVFTVIVNNTNQSLTWNETAVQIPVIKEGIIMEHGLREYVSDPDSLDKLTFSMISTTLKTAVGEALISVDSNSTVKADIDFDQLEFGDNNRLESCDGNCIT